MKKIVKITFVVIPIAIGVLFSSCKSHEKCPAYGQMKKSHRAGATG